MASLPIASRALPQAAANASSLGERQAAGLLGELGVLVVTSLLCIALYWAGSYELVSLIISVVLLTVNAVANFRMVLADPAMLLTPLFGVRLSAMVVFGIGGLIDWFAPPRLRLLQDTLYVTSDAESSRVMLLWLLGMTALIAGVVVAMSIYRKDQQARADLANLNAMPLTIGLWMFFPTFAILTGKAVFFTTAVLPGVVDYVVLAFQLCGLFLIAQHVGTSRAALMSVCVGLAGLILSAVLFQSKAVALYPALITMLGMLSKRLTWRRALASAFVILLIFVVIAPVVTYGRQRMALEFGESGGSLADRWRYVEDYAKGDRIIEDDVGLTFSRLNYVMPVSFVMAQFDQGMASDRLATSGYIFIPRLIWPDKPFTSGSGLEVNHLMGSQSTNQIGVTIFGDLYWNIGWYGLVLAAVMGIYFGAVSILCHSVVSRGDWMLVPFALASLRLGLNLDNDFPSGFMAPAVINLVLFLLLRSASRVLPHLGSEPTT